MNRFYQLRIPKWSPLYSLYDQYPITVEILCRWSGEGKQNVAVKLPDGSIIVRPFRGLRKFDGPTTREEHRLMEKKDDLEWMAAEPVDTDKAIADLNRALDLNFTPDVKFLIPDIDDLPLSADPQLAMKIR